MVGRGRRPLLLSAGALRGLPPGLTLELLGRPAAATQGWEPGASVACPLSRLSRVPVWWGASRLTQPSHLSRAHPDPRGRAHPRSGRVGHQRRRWVQLATGCRESPPDTALLAALRAGCSSPARGCAGPPSMRPCPKVRPGDEGPSPPGPVTLPLAELAPPAAPGHLLTRRWRSAPARLGSTTTARRSPTRWVSPGGAGRGHSICKTPTPGWAWGPAPAGPSKGLRLGSWPHHLLGTGLRLP